MHWVIQDSPYREEGHHALKGTLERMEIPFTEVKVVPFSHDIIPEPQVKNPIIVMGTLSLCNGAIARGWKPGVFINDNFDYRLYLKHYGDHMLNNDAIICEVGSVPHKWNTFFIRPVDDSKAFAGRTLSFCEHDNWAQHIEKIQDENYTTIDLSTPVVVAPLKDILREYRFFVIGGEIITGSRYKLGDRVTYNTNVDDANEFTQEMVDLWQPHEAFVIDIALTPDGYRVLEINCLNSAGYYAADVSKLVQSIERYFS